MRFIRLLILLMLLICFAGFIDDPEKRSFNKITTNEHYNYIHINKCFMWVANNGDGSHDPKTGGNGFYWPHYNQPYSSPKSAIFEDGLLWGGIIDGQVRVNGNTHRQGLQAGKILPSDIPDDPSLEKYRVYRIRKNWRALTPGTLKDQFERDWNEWPAEDGAPWVDIDGDGKFTRGIDAPECIGDETLWYVMNDQDKTRSFHTFGSPPIGLEIQCTVFGFDQKISPLSDAVFKKYKIINKSKKLISDMYFGYWSDPDLGDANDDLIGCDSILNLAFTYNGKEVDLIYGIPPAVGYTLLQGPIVNGSTSDSGKFGGAWHRGKKNLGLNSFIGLLKVLPFRDPSQGIYSGSLEFYNYMQGKLWNGSQIINPKTNVVTKFTFNGNPVTKSGWIDGDLGGVPPADRRLFASTGPFNFAPDDTQEVVFGISMASGYSRLSSVKILKESARFIQSFYDRGLSLSPDLPQPKLHFSASERSINFYWNDEAESFKKIDPLIPDTLFFSILNSIVSVTPTKKQYEFEGYRLWQFENEKGDNPRLIASFDLKNNISRVLHIKDKISDTTGITVTPIMELNNEGISHKHSISHDFINDDELFPGSDYYYGLTMLAYSEFSYLPIAESSPVIIKVTPGRSPVDLVYSHQQGEKIQMQQTRGSADVKFFATVFDPLVITDDQYKLSFTKKTDTLFYHLVNVNKNDTVAASILSVFSSFNNKPIYDTSKQTISGGFYFKVEDQVSDTLKKYYARERIRTVAEIRTPSGELSAPKNVLYESNSTGDWKLTAGTVAYSGDPYKLLDPYSSIQNFDYEIKFTAQGSQFYYSIPQGSNPLKRSDSLSNFRLPFEVWRTDQFGNSERCLIKMLDMNRNTKWNYDSTAGQFENIYVYTSAQAYSEPLPALSGNIEHTNIRLRFSFAGGMPAEGTVIKISIWKKLTEGNEYVVKLSSPKIDNAYAKQNLDKISVFPNPYFGRESFEDTREFVTFTNLPQKVVVRIYSLGGTFIQKLEKDNSEQYLRWDLKNRDGYFVGSGVYLAYLDMPGIGAKVMKVAVIQENRLYLGN